jgi:hypothetical protein
VIDYIYQCVWIGFDTSDLILLSIIIGLFFNLHQRSYQVLSKDIISFNSTVDTVIVVSLEVDTFITIHITHIKFHIFISNTFFWIV